MLPEEESPEIPEEEFPEVSEEFFNQEPTTSNIVILDQEQYQTLVDISYRADLLTNRLDILLLGFILFITLFIFNLMRSKS